MAIELSEEQVRRLAMFFATQQRNRHVKFDIMEYPLEIKSYYDFYKSNDNSLIIKDDIFNVNLAVEKFFVESTKYKWRNYGSKSIKTLDNILNLCKKHDKHFEVISAIINYKDRVHIGVRESLNDWIINNIDIDEKWIELYFKKFWTIEEKQFILLHLINKDKKEIIERFWKSRAVKIKRELIKIVDVRRLPFLLDEKDAVIKSIIEKRMNEESSKN